MDAPSTTPESSTTLDEAFGELTTVLAADGFAAEWDADADRRLRFRILATDAACAECLVPRVVLESMLTAALEGTGYELAEVALPGETP